MPAQYFHNLGAYRHHRIQAGHRLLKNHGDRIAADRAHGRLRQADEVTALEIDPAFERGAGRQQLHDRERGSGLAATRFTDEREHLVLMHGETQVVHCMLGAEAHGEPIDFQYWFHHERSERRGLRASLRPSPSRFSASTVSTSAPPGKAVRYHAVRSISRPSPIMLPQLTTFGSPMPRNDSADSMRMAVATITEVVTMMGGSAFGSISRQIMRAWPKPRLRAAITKSLCTSERNSARTRRVMVGQEVTPIASEMTVMEGCPIDTITMTNRNDGVVWNSSVTRMRTSSTQPPKYPASAPTSVPITTPISAAVTPMASDARLPWASSASTSRPRESVPSQYCGSCPGASRGCATISSGSPGKSLPAKSAMSSSASSNAAPLTTDGLRASALSAGQRRVSDCSGDASRGLGPKRPKRPVHTAMNWWRQPLRSSSAAVSRKSRLAPGWTVARSACSRGE